MEQLREVLKEVLQEELKSALGRELAPINAQLSAMQMRLDSLEGHVSTIQTQLDRIERTQQEDVVALLQTIDKKIQRIDKHEHQIELLNQRLLSVEADVKMLQAR